MAKLGNAAFKKQKQKKAFDKRNNLNEKTLQSSDLSRLLAMAEKDLDVIKRRLKVI
jgi:hypothetical protein